MINKIKYLKIYQPQNFDNIATKAGVENTF